MNDGSESGSAATADPGMPDGDGRSRERIAQDRLRALGLPLVLERRVRARALMRRTAAVNAALGVFAVGYAMASAAASALFVDPAGHLEEGNRIEDLPGSDPLGDQLLLALVVMSAAPLVLWLVAVVQRRVGDRVGTVIGVLSAALLLAGVPAFVGFWVTPGFVIRVSAFVTVAVLTYFGVGTLLSWATKRVVREMWALGPVVSRVLPLLTLTMLFFFFNAEIWQIAVALTFPRAIAAVAVLGALCVILAYVTSREELRPLLLERVAQDAVDGGCDADGDADADASLRACARGRARPLRKGERFNVTVVPTLVTLMQACLVAVVVFVFFVFFGWLSIPDATAELWARHASVRFGGVFGHIRISATLLKVSLVLAAFAALNFVAAAGSDPRHRKEFLEPLLDEVVEGLDARDEYVGRERSARAGA